MSTAAQALHRDPAVLALTDEALASMKKVCSSLVHAVVLTDDGFEVTHLGNGWSKDGADGRLASMASSIQALSEAVARELRLGSADSVVIESVAGHVVQRRVTGRELVIAALFDGDETLGKALSITRVTADRLAESLSAVPVAAHGA